MTDISRLLPFRIKHSLSQQNMADAIGYCTRQIQRLEDNESEPTAHFLKLFDIYACYKKLAPLDTAEKRVTFCKRVANVLETKYL